MVIIILLAFFFHLLSTPNTRNLRVPTKANDFGNITLMRRLGWLDKTSLFIKTKLYLQVAQFNRTKTL